MATPTNFDAIKAARLLADLAHEAGELEVEQMAFDYGRSSEAHLKMAQNAYAAKHRELRELLAGYITAYDRHTDKLLTEGPAEKEHQA